MQKLTIQFENFDGEAVSEDLYFHLNIKELQAMEEWPVPLTKRIADLTNTQDGKKAFELMRDIIEAAYGERSEDGKRFVKNPEVLKNFTQGLAYDEVIIKFIDGSMDLAKFIEGLLPKKVFELAKKNVKDSHDEVKKYLVESDVNPEVADAAVSNITEDSAQE
nr:MAG TPA: hypothetical protein [Caudoviricetes sp.]